MHQGFLVVVTKTKQIPSRALLIKKILVLVNHYENKLAPPRTTRFVWLLSLIAEQTS